MIFKLKLLNGVSVVHLCMIPDWYGKYLAGKLVPHIIPHVVTIDGIEVICPTLPYLNTVGDRVRASINDFDYVQQFDILKLNGYTWCVLYKSIITQLKTFKALLTRWWNSFVLKMKRNKIWVRQTFYPYHMEDHHYRKVGWEQ